MRSVAREAVAVGNDLHSCPRRRDRDLGQGPGTPPIGAAPVGTFANGGPSDDRVVPPGSALAAPALRAVSLRSPALRSGSASAPPGPLSAQPPRGHRAPPDPTGGLRGPACEQPARAPLRPFPLGGPPSDRSDLREGAGKNKIVRAAALTSGG
jgi:hypothetical protein